jgi:hypothetical protein
MASEAAAPAAAQQNVGVAGMEEASVCDLLKAPKALGDKFGTRLKLRVKKPEGWASETVAAQLMQLLKPDPVWVAARTTDLFVEFVAVWNETRQPKREDLKKHLPAAIEQEADFLKKVFQTAGVHAWRFDAVASLQHLRADAKPGQLSVAGLLTEDKLAKLAAEMRGLSSWGDRDKDLAGKAQELMRRHVYGKEDLETRIVADPFFQADLLRRKGPEAFVKEMKERVRQQELLGQTLVSHSTTAAQDAEPLQTALDFNGSAWQLEVISGLAKPVHQIRGVLVLGPPRCGKSHMGHQLHKVLPAGTVVKVQEADQADIYTFGTKLASHTVLLQLDEFEAKTSLAKLKNLLEPHNDGFEVRTGSSKGNKTHTTLPKDLLVLITSNWTKDEITATYKRGGASDQDLDALWERLTIIDLFSRAVAKRPREERQDIDPKRVAATVSFMASRATVPFPRQAVPSSSSLFAPPSPPPESSPVASLKRKARCSSAPSKLARAAGAV